MNTKVIINGEDYLLDVKQATQQGNLTKAPSYPLQVGDVYKHPKRPINPLLLVQVTYDKPTFQLLGIGCRPNSGRFFNTPHTLPEIVEYLHEWGMVFSHNINTKVEELVYGK